MKGSMNTQSDKCRTLTVYFGLSVLVHLFVLLSLGRFGSYRFAAPVNPLTTLMVDLAKMHAAVKPHAATINRKTVRTGKAEDDAHGGSKNGQVLGQEAGSTPSARDNEPVEQKSLEPAETGTLRTDTTRISEPPPAPQPAASRHMASAALTPPALRTADEFLSSKSEKLSYLVSLRGIPVGSMELEAKNENNEIRISLHTKSNASLSGIYPVDNSIETRHIGGNFIITKIRQQEGSFSSDIGYTIFLRDKRVFWIDRIRKRHSNETIPNSEVLDTLSSFYYLRNRPLQVGKTELLQIYDGDVYAPVPVEILRQEEVQLRNLKKVDSLLLRHLKQKGGIFRRTGDMLIWLTNDEHKVPVKLETTTQLGKVTIELVSSETEPFDKQ